MRAVFRHAAYATHCQSPGGGCVVAGFWVWFAGQHEIQASKARVAPSAADGRAFCKLFQVLESRLASMLQPGMVAPSWSIFCAQGTVQR